MPIFMVELLLRVRGLKAAVMDDCGGVWLREARRNGGEEGLHLDLAVGAEARDNAIEVGVIVAGMADQLEGALGWEGVEDFCKRGGVEIAGGGDADGALRREDLMIADLWVAIEGGLQAVEEADLQATLEAGVGELLGEYGLEGIADGADVHVFEHTKEWAGDGGEEMCVLVGVHVGDGDAGSLEAGDLGVGFAHNVFFADLTEEEGAKEQD